MSAKDGTGSPLRRISCKDLAAMRSLVSEEWSGWSNEFTVS